MKGVEISHHRKRGPKSYPGRHEELGDWEIGGSAWWLVERHGGEHELAVCGAARSTQRVVSCMEGPSHIVPNPPAGTPERHAGNSHQTAACIRLSAWPRRPARFSPDRGDARHARPVGEVGVGTAHPAESGPRWHPRRDGRRRRGGARGPRPRCAAHTASWVVSRISRTASAMHSDMLEVKHDPGFVGGDRDRWPQHPAGGARPGKAAEWKLHPGQEGGDRGPGRERAHGGLGQVRAMVGRGSGAPRAAPGPRAQAGVHVHPHIRPAARPSSQDGARLVRTERPPLAGTHQSTGPAARTPPASREVPGARGVRLELRRRRVRPEEGHLAGHPGGGRARGRLRVVRTVRPYPELYCSPWSSPGGASGRPGVPRSPQLPVAGLPGGRHRAPGTPAR